MGITFGKDGGNGHKPLGKPSKEDVRQAIQQIGGVPGEIVENIVKAFDESAEHTVRIWYWKDIDTMHKAYEKKLPKSWRELKPGYVLMWQGRMGWNGTIQEALGVLFTSLQDEGTGPFFSQAEVERKLRPTPHTSMSVGDVVGIDGKMYLCLALGWEELTVEGEVDGNHVRQRS